MKRVTWMVCLCVWVSLAVSGQSVKASRLFSDGMVLQQNSLVPVWGTAPAGTEVRISGSWNHEVVLATADENRRWEVQLTTPAGGNTPYQLTINEGVIQNVLIGEVWLCSGQSNMKFRLGESWADNWQVKDDRIQELRFFEVGVTRSNTPLEEVEGVWRYGAFDNNMQHISAVGYYFGRFLQKALQVPVGMIGFYEGGTAAEEWTEKACFDQCEALKGTYDTQAVGRLYNGMVAPVVPYKNAGVIWYQGENNVGHQHSYKTLMKVMVEGWRKDFREEALPFYIAQLTSYENDDWRTFREIQEEIANELPNSGLAVTTDGGDATEIHSPKKKLVGDRLASIALGRVYGLEDYPVSSPVFREQVVEGNKIRVYFKYVKDGFEWAGEAQEVQHFEVCGADGTYYPASARIEGNTILVWNENVTEPVAVRYFWKKYAVPTVYTKDKLPIVPFRTQK